MNFNKRVTSSIALVGVLVTLPMLNTVSAMEDGYTEQITTKQIVDNTNRAMINFRCV